jgi:hypothetical protein
MNETPHQAMQRAGRELRQAVESIIGGMKAVPDASERAAALSASDHLVLASDELLRLARAIRDREARLAAPPRKDLN